MKITIVRKATITNAQTKHTYLTEAIRKDVREAYCSLIDDSKILKEKSQSL